VAIIYFVLGQNDEAYFMLAAIVAVSGISFIKTIEVEKHLKR
jgi:Ca2+-transporting ATPase